MKRICLTKFQKELSIKISEYCNKTGKFPMVNWSLGRRSIRAYKQQEAE